MCIYIYIYIQINVQTLSTTSYMYHSTVISTLQLINLQNMNHMIYTHMPFPT